MTRWVLIAGDFTPLGGMDRANFALALDLAARRGDEVHVVAHRVWPDLQRAPGVRVHQVRRPLGSHMLGAPLLAAEGRRCAARLHPARVIANGGNADTGDVNWVHYLHAAHAPLVSGLRRRLTGSVAHRYYLNREREALTKARIVICNSARTARDVSERIGVEPARTRVVYYGSDPQRFSLVSPAERAEARRELRWEADRPTALFVGALGDRRKGFDRLFEAWRLLCSDAGWDVDLAVAGHGADLSRWRRRAIDTGVGTRFKFIGFREDISRVLAASDVLVHPARYEAYGLGVHEAICRGLPAIVSAAAGVAELYPAELADHLIRDVEDANEIADRLHTWRWDMAAGAARVRALSDRLRSRTWRQMSDEIVAAVGA